MDESIKMTVSAICTDKSVKSKYASVTFSDGKSSAEGMIPS